jgi:Fur family ferric uptake transcriptional regulator
MQEDSLVLKVKALGARMTPVRKEMLLLFENHSMPISVQEILHFLQEKNLRNNKTTIYREIEFLLKNNVVKEVSFGDKKIRFEKTDPHCHHHVVCEQCGNIEDITIPEKVLMSQMEKRTKYKIKKHTMEFFGICQKCQLT